MGILYDGAIVIDDMEITAIGIVSNSLDKHIVGLWHFDEGSGVVAKDGSGNGNTGRICGAKWVRGKVGRALEFDGEDDVVRIKGSSSLDLREAFTIEAWIYPFPRSKTTGYIIVRRYKGHEFLLNAKHRKLTLIIWNKKGHHSYTSEKKVPFSTLSRVAVTWKKREG